MARTPGHAPLPSQSDKKCYATPQHRARIDHAGVTRINRQVRRAWELLYLLTFRELKLRYQDTFFGFLWSLIRPLLLGAVLFVVLRKFIRIDVPDYHLVRFSQDFRTLRRRAPSGITGLWQVTRRSEGDLRFQEDGDTYYIRNWSPWLDLWILLRTLRVVLGGRGSY